MTGEREEMEIAQCSLKRKLEGSEVVSPSQNVEDFPSSTSLNHEIKSDSYMQYFASMGQVEQW